MESLLEKRGAMALRAYVAGDFAEVETLSAFKEIPAAERAALLRRDRRELAAIDAGRLLILESMLLPLDQRTG